MEGTNEKPQWEAPKIIHTNSLEEAWGNCVTGSLQQSDSVQFCTVGNITANQHRCQNGSDTHSNNACNTGGNATQHACQTGGDTQTWPGGACQTGTSPT